MPNTEYSYTYQADDFTWSPTGNMVLFRQLSRWASKWELYLLNTNTKKIDLIERQIGGFWNFHQMWSPDGEYFIFIGGHPTRTIKIQNAYSAEQIEVKVPTDNALNISDLYWMNNNSVYYSGLWRN